VSCPQRTLLPRSRRSARSSNRRAPSWRNATAQLGEEREAIAIQALVLVGRYAEARDRAALFEASSPDSLFRPAVEASLASIP
jgi:hypothetical protein